MKGYNNFQLVIRITTAVIMLAAVISSFMVYDTPSTEGKGKVLLIVSVGAALLLIAETILFWDRTKKYIAKMSTMISRTERDSLLNFPAPVIIIDEDNTIVWYNKLFGVQVYSDEEAFGLNICDLVNIDMEKIYTPDGDLICLDRHFYKARSYNIITLQVLFQ